MWKEPQKLTELKDFHKLADSGGFIFFFIFSTSLLKAKNCEYPNDIMALNPTFFGSVTAQVAREYKWLGVLNSYVALNCVDSRGSRSLFTLGSSVHNNKQQKTLLLIGIFLGQKGLIAINSFLAAGSHVSLYLPFGKVIISCFRATRSDFCCCLFVRYILMGVSQLPVQQLVFACCWLYARTYEMHAQSHQFFFLVLKMIEEKKRSTKRGRTQKIIIITTKKYTDSEL